jgi:hypothetical protein
MTPALKQDIVNLAAQWKGPGVHYDGSFGAPCSDACVVTVNNLVHAATGHYLGSSNVADTDTLKANGSISQIKPPTNPMPGDLMIVDSPNGKDAHIGVCETSGCTDVISNSSGDCYFDFDSTTQFNYTTSPYPTGSAVTYWSIN